MDFFTAVPTNKVSAPLKFSADRADQVTDERHVELTFCFIRGHLRLPGYSAWATAGYPWGKTFSRAWCLAKGTKETKQQSSDGRYDRPKVLRHCQAQDFGLSLSP